MVRFVGVFVICCLGICLGSELSTVSPNSIVPQGYSKNTTKDGFTKRGITVEKLTRKSYDPPPEYYRGPASSSGSSAYDNNRDNDVAEYSSRPVAFPQENYGFRGSSSGSWSSNNGQQERKGLHDRVSVEQYGTGSSHSGYGGGGSGNHGYGSTTGAHPYGPPQAIEYEYYAPTGNSQSYSEGVEGIPVELYNRGYGGYGHAGEYATYSAHSGHGSGEGGGHIATSVGHEKGKQGYDKALLAKSFLIPLASAAVLGIAAALASNPLLLQLGTVSSIGKRKKRELDEKLVDSRAYRGHRRN